MIYVVDRHPSVHGLEYAVGDRVLVRRDSGLAPAEALITANNPRRPHLVKVKYLRPRTGGAWIARTRVIHPAADDRSSRATTPSRWSAPGAT